MKHIRQIIPVLLVLVGILVVQCGFYERAELLASLHEKLESMVIENVESAHYRIRGSFLESESFIKEGVIQRSVLNRFLSEVKNSKPVSQLAIARGCSIKIDLIDAGSFYFDVSANSTLGFAAVRPYLITEDRNILAPDITENEYYHAVSTETIMNVFEVNDIKYISSVCLLDQLGDVKK